MVGIFTQMFHVAVRVNENVSRETFERYSNTYSVETLKGDYMAKRKLTAAQRKARKRKSYIRAEYYKNFDALEYIRDFAKVKDVKIPSRITKKSLESIRKIYKEARKKAEEAGAVLPTKKEMAQFVRETEPTQSYRIDRAEGTEAPEGFSPDEQYLEDLKQKISDLWQTRETASELQPLRDSTKTAKQYNDTVLPKFQAAKQRLLGSIDYAITKLGIEQAAQTLANNVFMNKVAELQEKYTYQIIESVDSDVIPLIESSVGEALNGI